MKEEITPPAEVWNLHWKSPEELSTKNIQPHIDLIPETSLLIFHTTE